MPKYQEIAHLKVDYDFFDEIRNNEELVAEEILCSHRKQNPIGALFKVSYYGRKFFAIRSNWSHISTHYKHGKRKGKVVDRKVYKDILFGLTDKGLELVKELLIEQGLKT